MLDTANIQNNRAYTGWIPQQSTAFSDSLIHKVKRIVREFLILITSIPRVIAHYVFKIATTCSKNIGFFLITNRTQEDSLTHEQLELIGIALGYKGFDRGGMCHGISFIGIQAGLAGDMSSFNDRIKKLGQIVYKHKGNIKEVVESIKKDNHFLNECLAFFDGVILWQSPNLYNYLMKSHKSVVQGSSEHLEAILPITTSSKLELQGKMSKMGSYSGVYSFKELCSCLRQIRKVISNSSTASIAIQCKSADHAMSIIYDSKTQRWLFNDPNESIIFTEESDASVAKKIIAGMQCEVGSPKRVCLVNNVYGIEKKSYQLKKRLNEWINSKKYKSLHSVFHKKSLSKSQKASWLWISSQCGQLNVVKELLFQGIDPNTPNEEGITPLWIAVQNNHVDVVKKLLEKGGSLNQANHIGVTPLLMAAVRGYSRICIMLLKKGANPNITDNKGMTPLWIAAQNGSLDIVKALLAKGANPDTKNHEGVTPLFIASQQGHKGIVKILLEKGADPHIINNKGGSPLQIAEERGYLEIAELLRSIK